MKAGRARSRRPCLTSRRRDGIEVRKGELRELRRSSESECSGSSAALHGAIPNKPGKFEFAHEGTMFLDEISEMHPPLQSKLLQVLQDGEFARLGGRQDVHVDVRILAATNRDLDHAVAEGQFREDLFFRLNVVCITLPPRRQRRARFDVTARFWRNKPNTTQAAIRPRERHEALFAEYVCRECARAREPAEARRDPRHR